MIKEKNTITQMRYSGVLLPVFSLPGAYGIGDMGPGADRFISFLAECGFGSWQVLPLTPIGPGYSPYQSTSTTAGNVWLISPDVLKEQGLLTRSDCQQAQLPQATDHVAYEAVKIHKERLFRKAYQAIDTGYRRQLDAFIEQEADWLTDYAAFCVIRGQLSGLPWWRWPDAALRQAQPVAIRRFVADRADEVDYVCFLMHAFFHQWQQLKDRANRQGIELIGDLPIYVAADSVDVWRARAYFEVTAEGRFNQVAGVPPDYFSPDGQLWGNPLYNWKAHRKDRFSWWVSRIRKNLTLYDTVRIDHFRGFEHYWAVPAGAPTAREGRWLQGPGRALFDALFEACPDARIIAEDLGDIDDEVRALLHQTGIPGMKVMQFSFNPQGSEKDRPHRYPPHCVAYTGTHDNTTLTAWLQALNGEHRRLVEDYCGGLDRKNILRCLWQTAAQRVIIPVQDCLDLGEEARINTPGTTTNNWLFRLTDEQLSAIDRAYLSRLNHSFGRDGSPL